MPRQASLRRNNPTQRMTPRQHNAAMIDVRPWAGSEIERGDRLPFDQSSSASRTPVGACLSGKQSVAMAADALHNIEDYRIGRDLCRSWFGRVPHPFAFFLAKGWESMTLHGAQASAPPQVAAPPRVAAPP